MDRKATPVDARRQGRMRVVDDRGCRLLARRGAASNNGVFSGTIALEPASATVDLTFGLTRLRTLEIIAQPSLGP